MGYAIRLPPFHFALRFFLRFATRAFLRLRNVLRCVLVRLSAVHHHGRLPAVTHYTYIPTACRMLPRTFRYLYLTLFYRLPPCYVCCYAAPDSTTAHYRSARSVDLRVLILLPLPVAACATLVTFPTFPTTHLLLRFTTVHSDSLPFYGSTTCLRLRSRFCRRACRLPPPFYLRFTQHSPAGYHLPLRCRTCHACHMVTCRRFCLPALPRYQLPYLPFPGYSAALRHHGPALVTFLPAAFTYTTTGYLLPTGSRSALPRG